MSISLNGDGIISGVSTFTTPITGITVSGVTTVSAGSAAAPSIVTFGDTNTGVFFPAADSVAIANGGGEALRVTNSRLGIGTANPAAPLHCIGGSTSGSVDTAAIFTGGVINTIGSGARIYFSGTPGFETIRGAYIEGVFDTATNAHSLRFGTNSSSATPTERMRILPAGGLTFNGDTAAANALDDYEEGTWTPANSVTTLTNLTTATYTKVGRFVYVNFDFTLATNASGSAIGITGLPFTAGSQCFGVIMSDNFNILNAFPFVASGSTTMQFQFSATSGGSRDTVAYSRIVSGGVVRGSLCYIV